jgi:hypothetical protein
MGLSELMASVVSGITSALFEVVLPAGADTAVPVFCGAAAFAACSFTSRDRTTTDTTGNNTITHRIFMNKPLFWLRDGIIPQAVE